MKNYIIILFVLLASVQAFAKKDKKDEKDLKIDSLTKAIDSLKVNFDSLNTIQTLRYDTVSERLNNVYIIIKEKVLKKEFDKERLPQVMDSLIALRDSNFTKYNTNTASLMDSLTILKKENVHLKATISGITADEASNNRVVNELKQLKNLLDSKIITQTEFDIKKTKLLEKWH